MLVIHQKDSQNSGTVVLMAKVNITVKGFTTGLREKIGQSLEESIQRIWKVFPLGVPQGMLNTGTHLQFLPRKAC